MYCTDEEKEKSEKRSLDINRHVIWGDFEDFVSNDKTTIPIKIYEECGGAPPPDAWTNYYQTTKKTEEGKTTITEKTDEGKTIPTEKTTGGKTETTEKTTEGKITTTEKIVDIETTTTSAKKDTVKTTIAEKEDSTSAENKNEATTEKKLSDGGSSGSMPQLASAAVAIVTVMFGFLS